MIPLLISAKRRITKKWKNIKIPHSDKTWLLSQHIKPGEREASIDKVYYNLYKVAKKKEIAQIKIHKDNSPTHPR